MGTIEERLNDNGKKSYRAKVRIKGFPPQTATFTRKTDAKHWIIQTESEIREGRHFNKAKSKKHTVGDVIDRYLLLLEKDNPKRAKDVCNLLQWWKKEIGHYQLFNLSKDIFIQTREKLQNKERERKKPQQEVQKLNSATVNRYWIALQTALNIAVNEWEWMVANPMQKIKKLQESEGRKRFLSDDELERLLEACKKSQNKYLLVVVVLVLSTGGRRSEVLKLKWSDVHFKKNALRLHVTKNKSARTLHLHGSALSLLQKLYKERSESDFIFASPNSNDRPIDIRSAWEAALERANIKDFRFHDLRHSAASYLAMNGASLIEIAEILGHKSLEMVKRYAHLTETHTSNVVKNMNLKVLNNAD